MKAVQDTVEDLPGMPSRVAAARPETPEDAAFFSGAALGHLNLLLGREDVPRTLLRARLALRAAENCMAVSGRPERAGDLRDAVTFLQPGDSPGPAGAVYLSWRRAVERPVSIAALRRAVPDADAGQVAACLDAGQGAPVARAVTVLRSVLRDRPGDPAVALVLADAALARALGWKHVLPLLAPGLGRGDLRKDGDALRLACYRAILATAVDAAQTAADLARRMTRLQDVAPKLRARRAADAVALFSIHDVLPPAALTPLRSDRAARRFCDRLVALGAVREMTGRDSFRLYGV